MPRQPVKYQIKPGTLAIILAGRYRGRRVVVLQQQRDTLLVTGPQKLNGVPFRLVNYRYVIPTSKSVPIADIDYGKLLGRAPKRPNKATIAKRARLAKLLAEKEGKSVPEKPVYTDADKKATAAKKAEKQKQVDGPILQKLSGVEKKYLSSVFSLQAKSQPHLWSW
eukprot:TRINITY_DN63538_c0_g3_i1.p1 TRINITY_DN63538_c0_g3~~TRINITY_DN63538_c0_g3_i1.p1  ORF type:complete len:190 (-),score=31.38 TRINITY_DN63538_c0_g3_i1:81-578(-)